MMYVSQIIMSHTLSLCSAAYFSNIVWEIPWTEETGGLQSMELQKS